MNDFDLKLSNEEYLLLKEMVSNYFWCEEKSVKESNVTYSICCKLQMEKEKQFHEHCEAKGWF